MTDRAKTKIVFLGNCQAGALASAYNTFIAPSPDDWSIAIDWRDVQQHNLAAIQQADTVVLQVSDLAWSIPDYVPKRTRIVLFPYVSGGFLWPFGSEGHINYGRSRMGEYGVFGETGDAFLNRMIRQGVSPHEATDRYVDLDIVRIGNLDRRLELTLERQARRDEIAGMDVHTLIESRFRKEHLFLTRGHLGPDLSRLIAVQVFRRLDVPADRLERLARPNLQQFYEPDEHPIHPKVAEHFGLSYGQEGHRFRIHCGLYTFRDFSLAYMHGDFNAPIYDGLRALRQEQDPASAVVLLEQAVDACPDSVTGLLALAEAYHRLGDASRSVGLLERAAHLDPADARPLADLAARSLEARNFSKVKVLAQKILEWNPGHAHGEHLMQIVRAHDNLG